MLKPGSWPLRIWELLLALCVSFVAIVVPLQAHGPHQTRPQLRPKLANICALRAQVAFPENFEPSGWDAFNYVLDVIFIMDVCIRFRTGDHHHHHRRRRRRRRRRHHH